MFGERKKSSTIIAKFLVASMAFLIFIMPLILQVPVNAQTATASGLELSTLEADIENEMS